MKTLIDRLSDWWAERTAALEDRTEEIVVPPTDRMFDRLAGWFVATRQQLQRKASPWVRRRSKSV
jgi:hypothetical protein